MYESQNLVQSSASCAEKQLNVSLADNQEQKTTMPLENQEQKKKVPPAVPPKPAAVSRRQVFDESSGSSPPDSINRGTANIISPTPVSTADGHINNAFQVI